MCVLLKKATSINHVQAESQNFGGVDSGLYPWVRTPFLIYSSYLTSLQYDNITVRVQGRQLKVARNLEELQQEEEI